MMLNTTYDKDFSETIRKHMELNHPSCTKEYINYVIRNSCISFIRQSLDTLEREKLNKDIIEEYKKEFCYLLDEYYKLQMENNK